MTVPFIPWPCVDLSAFPLADDWSDSIPYKHLTLLQYERHVGTFRSLYDSPSMQKTYAQLRDYCFCQGAVTNANAMDMEFFYAILASDLSFFKGHLGVEIQQAFPIDRKAYPGVGVMRATHFDLFEVKSTPILGFARLVSLTSDVSVVAFTSLSMAPKRGDIVFGRLVPIGFLPRPMAWQVVEPFDTIESQHQTTVLATFQSQYDAFCQKFPGTSKAAFLKIAAYHIYENIESHELCDVLNAQLVSFGERLSPRTFRFSFEDASEVFDLTKLPKAKCVTQDGMLVTVPVFDNTAVHETLREVIVSRDVNTVEITAFILHAADKWIVDVIEPLVEAKEVIRQTIELDDNTTYRSLRHISN